MTPSHEPRHPDASLRAPPPPIISVADLRPGHHLCCVYESEEEHRAVLTPYLRSGLERGEKVLYLADTHSAETILGYLRDDGVDVAPFLASGQLAILAAQDAYLREGTFDPERMIALLRAETERAVAEGYSALRGTGEMTWALRGLPGSERLIEYEVKLNRFFPGSPCLSLCQYDRRRFEPSVLLDVLAVHPVVIVGTEVCDNMDFVPPAEFLAGRLPTARLRRELGDLAKRKRAEEELRESEERFRAIFEAAQDLIFVCDRELRYVHVNPAMARHFGVPASVLLGKTSDDLFEEEVAAHFREVNSRVLNGETVEEEFTDPVKGAPARVHMVKAPMRDSSGQVIGLCGIGRDVTERRRLQTELLRISEAERRRFGEELHDGLGQHLTGIAFMCKALAGKLAARALPEADDAEMIAGLVNQATELARSLAKGLCPVGVGAKTLVSALEDLASSVRDTHGISCGVQSDESIHVHDDFTANHLYRIAQEAVANALKHGRATEIAMRLATRDDHVILTVEDNGIGIPESPLTANGLGLRIMKHRAELIGASLDVRRREVGGTTIACTLPNSMSTRAPSPGR